MEVVELEFGASLAEQEILEAFNPEEVDQQQNRPPSPQHVGSSFAFSKSVFEVKGAPQQQLAPEALRELLCSDIIGDRTTYSSPNFDPTATGTSSTSGVVPLIYCDHTATHRALHSIETFVAEHCLPTLGNTHTLTSYTGCQSTSYVAEARQIVAESVNAKITGKAATDVVLFTGGTGVTSAVQLLIDLLQLKNRNLLQQQPAVIFVGPYEHHSNLIPWRECGCQIVTVPIHPIHGGIHMEALERLLSDPIYGYEDTSTAATTTRLRIGTFSVASNVTGRIADTPTITALLHQYNVLSFWDYATGASYLPIDMNPNPSSLSNTSSSSSMDALFLSPHKILGGSAGSSGILIVKKMLVSTTQPPERSGGGTVFYVTNTHHRFLSNRIDRYEGGTPNIPCILRIGLTFLNQRFLQRQLQLTQQEQQIKAMNNDHCFYNHKYNTSLQHYLTTWQTVVDRLTKTSPNLILLGTKHYLQNKSCNDQSCSSDTINETNLPIFSFLIQCGSRFLHHNYVCALLNDMFGIQTRGGCQCAGPYSQYLLGLTTNDNFLFPNEANQRLEEALLSDKIEILRIGFTRLSLPYLYLREIEIEYVMKALEFISRHGWKFLYQYRCNHRTGEWRHYSRQGKPLGSQRKWLHQFCPPFQKHQHEYAMNYHDDNKNLVAHHECEMTLKTDEECSNFRRSHSTPLSDSSNDNYKASDANTIKTENEKLSLSAWKDLLDMTLEKANTLLKQIHLDTKSIVPIMNATANESDILPQSMRDLRWFIYPSECAKMLYEGAEPTSNSQQELATILGAVQPLERKPSPTDLMEEHASHPKGTDVPRQNETLGPFIHHNIPSEGDKKLILDTADSCGTINGHKGNSTAICTTKKILRDSSTWGQPCTVGTCAPPSYCCAPTNDVAATSYQMVGQQWKNTCLNNRGKIKPPAKMMRLVIQAILQWEMIKDGDRLLLGLSGGKDSLSLLHCLLELQRKLPISFTVQVCTIDPLTPSFDPSPLIPYIQDTLGLQYHYVRADIVNRATKCGKDGQAVTSLCAFCAR